LIDHSRVVIIKCFFFSSRRRHTRFSRDWSSDVCSSDLLSHLEIYGRQQVGAIDLQMGQRRQQNKHQVPRNAALDERRGRVGEGILQHAHHHEARNQEGGVGQGVVHLHTTFQNVGEDQQIKQCSDHGGGNGLKADLPESLQFLAQQGGKTGCHIATA